MKIVIAPDSFKGSLDAVSVSNSIEAGFRNIFPGAEIIKKPMADGGEGTMQALIEATNGVSYKKLVKNSLGNQVEAEYGILGDGITGVIEMASASGIQHVDKKTANPMLTTTYGTGELLIALLDRGIRNFIIGLGGSATNDGGSGLASALGVRFLDKNEKEIGFGGGVLNRLARIDVSKIDTRLSDCKIEMASDVLNPLCGEDGASAVFGPQKGATPEMVTELDRNLEHYASVIQRDLGREVRDIPGAGAAGGLGAGMFAFTDAKLVSGITLVMHHAKLADAIKNADFVITGEGKIDYQTKFGKTPYGVCRLVKAENPECIVIGIAGMLGEDIDELYDLGFDALFPIIPRLSSIELLLKNGVENLKRTSENVARVIKKSKESKI